MDDEPPLDKTAEINTQQDAIAAPLAARKLYQIFKDKGWGYDRAFSAFGYQTLGVTQIAKGLKWHFPRERTITHGEMEMAMKFFDKNGDGRITRLEWKRSFMQIEEMIK